MKNRLAEKGETYGGLYMNVGGGFDGRGFGVGRWG